MKPGVARIVVVVIVLGMLVSAGGVALLVGLRSFGGSDSNSSSPVPVPAITVAPDPGSTDPPRPGLADFYSQQLDWSSCQGSFQCSTLTVPLDYRDPAGKTIDLALLKVPAAQPDARVGSMVVNPGGPGAPGTSYAAQANTVFRAPLRDHFDIVGFDPRGTGASDPVDCLTDQQLDDYIATDPDPDTAAEKADYMGWTLKFGKGCVAKSGDLATHVSTIEAARDMDVLRAALGESKLTYFGASYGTKLGATYADLFPDKVGRLVLDGAVDLSIDSRALSLGQAGGFETALRAYVEDCVGSADCPLGDSVDGGLARIKEFLDSVDAQPLPTGTDRDLAVGNAFYGIVAPLYNRDYWYILTQALDEAFGGSGATLLLLSDLYTSRADGGGYTDNSAEAIYAINCLDDPYAIPASEVPANYADFEKASPTFGRVFAWALTTCEGVQAKTTEAPREIRAAGAPPIVVVGTTRDPATPYIWAVHLAEQLKSGVLISRDGDGHTGYNSGNDCVNNAVEDYLVNGVVPQDGLNC